MPFHSKDFVWKSDLNYSSLLFAQGIKIRENIQTLPAQKWRKYYLYFAILQILQSMAPYYSAKEKPRTMSHDLNIAEKACLPWWSLISVGQKKELEIPRETASQNNLLQTGYTRSRHIERTRPTITILEARGKQSEMMECKPEPSSRVHSLPPLYYNSRSVQIGCVYSPYFDNANHISMTRRTSLLQHRIKSHLFLSGNHWETVDAKVLWEMVTSEIQWMSQTTLFLPYLRTEFKTISSTRN